MQIVQLLLWKGGGKTLWGDSSLKAYLSKCGVMCILDMYSNLVGYIDHGIVVQKHGQPSLGNSAHVKSPQSLVRTYDKMGLKQCRDKT